MTKLSPPVNPHAAPAAFVPIRHVLVRGVIVVIVDPIALSAERRNEVLAACSAILDAGRDPNGIEPLWADLVVDVQGLPDFRRFDFERDDVAPFARLQRLAGDGVDLAAGILADLRTKGMSANLRMILNGQGFSLPEPKGGQLDVGHFVGFGIETVSTAYGEWAVDPLTGKVVGDLSPVDTDDLAAVPA